jgi:hypothetical protein
MEQIILNLKLSPVAWDHPANAKLDKKPNFLQRVDVSGDGNKESTQGVLGDIPFVKGRITRTYPTFS